MRAVLAALAITLALAAPAAASGAKPPALSYEGMVWAGPDLKPGGWVLEQPDQGHVRAIGERDGKVYEQPLSADCGALTMRFPRVLLTCGATSTTGGAPAFVDVRTGAVQPIPVTPNPLAACQPNYATLGKYWLTGYCSGSRGTFYLNWRTGEQRYVPPSGKPLRNETTYLDVDDPDLARRPLVRCAGQTFGYRPPAPAWTVVSDPKDSKILRLRRCSGGPSTILATDAIESGQVKGRYVAWQTPTKVALYDMTTRTTRRWTRPRSDPASGFMTRIALGERSLFVVAGRGSGVDAMQAVYRVRLP